MIDDALTIFEEFVISPQLMITNILHGGLNEGDATTLIKMLQNHASKNAIQVILNRLGITMAQAQRWYNKILKENECKENEALGLLTKLRNIFEGPIQNFLVLRKLLEEKSIVESVNKQFTREQVVKIQDRMKIWWVNFSILQKC